jgi:DNA invertase Pin-like site-specific DNA recombinase
MKPKAYSYLRMSTDLQLTGDSRRRQLKASREYAEANGLTLASDGQLEDIGLSAFRGANVRDGALGRFLAAVERGDVPRGSYLLVESLDRLSREQVKVALLLFLRIGQAGITLVTLMDGRVHRPEDDDVGGLMMSLVSMNTAVSALGRSYGQREGPVASHYRKIEGWAVPPHSAGHRFFSNSVA